MGVFYQTSAPQQIDFAYHNPTELMKAAIANADSRNDAVVNQMGIVDDAVAKMQFLEQDRERAKQLTDSYRQKVDEIATDLSKNPQDWRKRMGTMRALGRQVSTDYSSGEIAAIQGNYNGFQSWYKDENERLKKGDITADWLNKAKAKYLGEFQGTQYDPTLSTGNQLKPSPLPKHIDLNQRFEEYFKNVKANAKEFKTVKGVGMYLIEQGGSREWVSEDRLSQIAAEKLAADDEVLGYVREGTRLGVFKDPMAVLNSAARGAIHANSFAKIKQAMDIKGDPVKAQEDQQAHAVSMQEDSQRHGVYMQDRGDALDDEDRNNSARITERNNRILWNLNNPGEPQLTIPELPAGTPFPGTEEEYYSQPDPNVEQGTGAQGAGASTQGTGTKPVTGAVARPAKGTSTSTLQLFESNELKPDVLRAKTLPLLNSTITNLNSRIVAADATGKFDLANQLREERDAALTQKNTAQGLVNQAFDDYYESKNYTSLPKEIQHKVKGYHDYLIKNGLTDNSDTRMAYNRNTGEVTMFMERNGLSKPITSESGLAFIKAAEKASGIMADNAVQNAISNRYDATGIGLNLGDPTITGLLNNAFNLGNVSTFAPNSMGGARVEGGQRGTAGYNISDWNGTDKFSIPKLMEATGAKTPTELFEEVHVMPATNGKRRFKVKLKPEVNGTSISPDGVAITGLVVNGLNTNREMIMEVQGTNQNAQILRTLAQDSSPEVRRLALAMDSPDNVNFMNKINSAVADVVSDKPDDFGVPVRFGYGNAIYSISKAGNGKVQAKVKIGDKTATIVADNAHDAEEELLLLKTNLDEDLTGTIKAMEEAGSFD